MVINDNFISKTTQRLRRVLGSNIDPHFKDACHPRNKKKGEQKYEEPSYLKVCFQSCRKGAGNQHMKFYLFSDDRAGPQRGDGRLHQHRSLRRQDALQRPVHPGQPQPHVPRLLRSSTASSPRTSG